MKKGILATLILFFSISEAMAQLGAMKMVGKDTKNYTLGMGVFIKSGFPATEGSDITFEIEGDVFFLNDDYTSVDGTLMCPFRVGYRYTLNKTGQGLYIEPQAGYNLYGLTSTYDDNGNQVDLKYHGVVFAAGTGYLFTLFNQPFDLNLSYETVISHGGSNNFVSLGISRFISFTKRDMD